jgi:hypothetical protein
MITHRYSPLCPKGLLAGYSECAWHRESWIIFGESGEKDLPFEKGGSKILLRTNVSRKHLYPKAAIALAAFFVFRGTYRGIMSVSFPDSECVLGFDAGPTKEPLKRKNGHRLETSSMPVFYSCKEVAL